MSRRKLLARKIKSENLQRRELTKRMLEQTKPDPVLGHQPNKVGEAVWENSELAKIVITKDKAWGVTRDHRGKLQPLRADQEDTTTFSQQSAQDAEEFGGPERLNFGLQRKDRELLFKGLPQIMVKDRVLDSANLGPLVRGSPERADIDAFEKELEKVLAEEDRNKEALGRILDLRNASGKGVQVENIRRIVQHFGEGTDTGSSEVQAAILTYRIRNLQEHLLDSHRHDSSNRRAMSNLVQQRAKVLKYLKRTKPHRYLALLPRIGIEARAVEGEIIVPGKPKMITE